ncbi:MAG: hypothetical protein WBB15_01620 [Ornithinimicrobium sp.]
MRRAAATTRGEQFLRRPYTYQDIDGSDVRTGLVFVTYQADPVRQFVPVQQRLAEADLMNLIRGYRSVRFHGRLGDGSWPVGEHSQNRDHRESCPQIVPPLVGQETQPLMGCRACPSGCEHLFIRSPGLSCLLLIRILSKGKRRWATCSL